MKRAVVASDVGAVSELVQDSVTGFIVPPLDPQALSNAILRLADAPALLRAMGARAHERAAAHYSAEECARIHLEAYDRALRRRTYHVEPSGERGRVIRGNDTGPK
jgi:glycosyltransferase involved in cell wall biosynthesis